MKLYNFHIGSTGNLTMGRKLNTHAAFSSCINYIYWLMHSEHMFGNSYELSICCFRRLFKSSSKSKEIISECKKADEAL